MTQPAYSVDVSADGLSFEFDSVGPAGIFRKIVVYSQIPDAVDVYNLGFGDLNEQGFIDDTVVTNNGDRNTVLATVVSTVFVFLDTFPNRRVFFKGSTDVRTQLYQRIIRTNQKTVDDLFVFRGFVEQHWESFQDGADYEAFLIQRI